MEPPPLQAIDVEGLRIAYRKAGDAPGPPLVLVHGAVSDSRDWLEQIEDLRRDHTIIAWDAPGAGASDDPPEPFGIDDWADSLAAFLRALDAAPAHVVGLSFGGTLALALYDRHPAAVASLILCGAYAGWKGSLPADECARRLELALASARMPPDELAAEWLPSLISPDTPPARRRELAEIVADAHPAGMRLMAHAMAGADLNHVLRRIEVPTLLLWGERDVRSPLALAETMRAAIPNARLAVIPGAGHVSNFDDPARFNAEVRAFLTEPRVAR